MDDNRKLAEEVWNKLRPYLDDMHYICETIAAYGEARYKAGMKAMRDAVRREMVGGDLDALAARLLEEK